MKTGDTLGAIAEKTGVPVEQLQELNPELDPQALVRARRSSCASERRGSQAPGRVAAAAVVVGAAFAAPAATAAPGDPAVAALPRRSSSTRATAR